MAKHPGLGGLVFSLMPLTATAVNDVGVREIPDGEFVATVCYSWSFVDLVLR